MWRNQIWTLVCLTKACVLSKEFHHLPAKCSLLNHRTPKDLEVVLQLNFNELEHNEFLISSFRFFILMVHKLCFKWVLCKVTISSLFTGLTRLNSIKSFTFCTGRVCTKNKTTIKLSNCNKKCFIVASRIESILYNLDRLYGLRGKAHTFPMTNQHDCRCNQERLIYFTR